ncbi:AbrB family transcriptional regulator [Tumebacillus sp. ITR2]|uniref:AbrB family transcriptional regulator n=1 Tax=Tumebacillus amylolyticus TaxID=2801339 RepID=A0ABS1JDD6_9BACL|nr:AbrB family transcriptional regulator [Tumebacillus amylolyticus]MBL0388291.1 AbrB family transcriptional regulator [Tumebacillus amylolyticus]
MALLPFLEALVVAVLGGGLFSLLHVPLAWMLGSIAAIMTWRLTTKRRLVWPGQLRNAGLVVLGYILATSVTRETVTLIGHHLPSMLVATVLTVLFGITMGVWSAKLTGGDVPSGVFGSVPGGLTQMVVLSEEVEEADPTVVTFMQTIRVIAVIFLVPFLTVNGIVGSSGDAGGASSIAAHVLPSITDVSWKTLALFTIATLGGAWLGIKLHLPAAPLTGPLLANAVVILCGFEPPQLPSVFLTLSQIYIGASIGLQMQPQKLNNLRKLTLVTILSSILLCGFALLVGSLLVWWNGDMSIATAFLSSAPGGIAEMGVTAHIVHADVSLVTGYQLFRIFFILFLVPPLLRRWIQRRSRTPRPNPGTNA